MIKYILLLLLLKSPLITACITTKILSLAHAAQSRGQVVVIDVLRAFTTTACAFEHGAKNILLVDTVKKAHALKKMHTEALLIGEQNGIKLEGFDYGNSPSGLSEHSLTNKTLIMRTTAGTQGVLAAGEDRVLVSSFVVADATARLIKQRKPAQLTFISTGQTKSVEDQEGDEDKSLADYLTQLMQCATYVDSDPYLERVSNSPRGREFTSGIHFHFPVKDLELALQLDRFNFAMEAERQQDNIVGTYFLLKQISPTAN